MPETHDLIPRPDPTFLTTEQLHREIEALGVLFDAKLKALEDLHEQKFRGIETQFIERDKRAEQLSVADKTAIDAALKAQKEAAGATNESNIAAMAKNDASVTKQIDGIAALITTITKGFDDKISDLASRLDRGDGHGKGLKDGWGYIVGAVAVAISLFIAFAPR